jgi:hypothetical protein
METEYNICKNNFFLLPSMAREEARADKRFLISMQKKLNNFSVM